MKKKIDIKFIIIMIVMGGIIFSAIMYGIVDPILTAHYLSKSSRVSITTSVVFYPQSGGGSFYRYNFKVNNKPYSGDTQKSNSLSTEKSTHYFVKYYPPNPDYNKVIKIIATQEDIDRLPPDGYEKLPHQ